MNELPKDPPDGAKRAEADRKVGELYLSHGNEILGHLIDKMRLRVEDAEDLLADVFTKLAERFLAGTPPTNPRGWLLEVARNEALRIIEKKGRDPVNRSLGAEGLPSDTVDKGQRRPVSALMSGEVKAITREALLGLAELSRKVVEMHLFEETPLPEVASALNLPLGRTEKIYQDAIKSVQDRLGAAFSSMVRPGDTRDHVPQTRKGMLEAIEKLGAKYARVLALRHDEGLDIRKIAPRLEIPVAEAERHLDRAHELLERRFGLSPDDFKAILGKGL